MTSAAGGGADASSGDAAADASGDALAWAIDNGLATVSPNVGGVAEVTGAGGGVEPHAPRSRTADRTSGPNALIDRTRCIGFPSMRALAATFA